MQKIAFIGLGHMGNPMVRNLLKSDFHVRVYDINKSAMDAVASYGAELTYSVADTVRDVELVFTMVQTGQAVKDLCLQDKGIFAEMNPNAFYVDCSSIEIAVTRELHRIAESKGIAFLDAPVSGGVRGAEAATLTLMVGGEEEHFQRVKPILEKLGSNVIYAGKAGMGQAAKICNNLILGISMIAVCEGFNLADKLGLDLKTFFDISSHASGQCWSMTSYCPVPGILDNVPANHHYQPGFMATMMLKDLHLAQQAAESVEAIVPLGSVAAELYTLFIDQGYGAQDFSAIFNMISG